MAQDERFEVLTVRVEDRFGDNGIVGVVILNDSDERIEIDTFLLSCRVIGRLIEGAVLSYIAALSADRGAKELVGLFVPTDRNGPAATIYSDQGFQKIDESPDGASRWALKLEGVRPMCPPSIEVCGEIPVHG